MIPPPSAAMALECFNKGKHFLLAGFMENPVKIPWRSYGFYGRSYEHNWAWMISRYLHGLEIWYIGIFLCTNFTESNSSSLNNYNMDSDAEHNSHNQTWPENLKRLESEDNLRHLSSQTIKPRLVSWSCGRAYHSAGNLESEWIRVNANSVAEYKGQVQVTCSKVILLSLIEWKICDFLSPFVSNFPASVHNLEAGRRTNLGRSSTVDPVVN